MSETPNTPPADGNLPRTDLMSSMGKEVTVYFRATPDLGHLGFELDGQNSVKARMVGFDRQGVWIEPSRSREDSLSRQASVPHFFLPWDLILSISRQVEAESFTQKPQYRGLRPQG